MAGRGQVDAAIMPRAARRFAGRRKREREAGGDPFHPMSILDREDPHQEMEGNAMNILGVVILVALFLLAVFTLANWSVLTAPTLLSFVAFDVEGPLGVILLGVTLVLVALFVLYALMLRTNMLMESRRYNQELQAQRKLAESAEASRLSDLRTQIADEFAQMRDAVGQADVRMDRVEQSMRQSMNEAANGLAALVGEMDDKIDRALARNAIETKGH
jgi:uncharacterized integral membrane protein